MVKLLMTIKCTSSAGRFDGHGGEPVQCSMQHVQGYSGSHWMPPLRNYLLRITPEAARATANKTTTKTCTHFAGYFDAVAVRRYVTAHIAWWRRSRASLEAIGHHHWVSIMSDNIIGTYLCRFYWYFSSSTCWKRVHSKRIAPTNTRGMTYQIKEKHLSNLREYFIGGGGGGG
jgi:hypothetical protein